MHKDAKICSDPISISPLHSYAFICTKYAKICKISEGMLVNVLFFFFEQSATQNNICVAATDQPSEVDELLFEH